MVRIIINDVDLDLFPNTRLPLTVKYFDIGDLTSRYVNFSQRVRIPDTPNNKKLLGLDGFEKSTSSIPYSKNQGIKIIIDGIEINNYLFTARSQKRDITIQFFGAESDFFDSINGLTCEDLDISSLNQVYDSTAKNGAKKSSSGIVNPLISYEEDLTTNVVLPSFYYKSLLELIAGLSGKTFAGAIMSDERLIKTILPWSRNKDINSDPQYRTSKEVKALSNGQTIVLSGGWTTVEFPNVIYQGEDGFGMEIPIQSSNL